MDELKPWERKIRETAKCPLLSHYIMGGEPYCESGGGEYPMLHYDCDDYTSCKHYTHYIVRRSNG